MIASVYKATTYLCGTMICHNDMYIIICDTNVTMTFYEQLLQYALNFMKVNQIIIFSFHNIINFTYLLTIVLWEFTIVYNTIKIPEEV